MKHSLAFSPRFAQRVGLVVLNLAGSALAGPPLICHPFDIGDAKSLPWTGSAWNLSGNQSYDTGKGPSRARKPMRSWRAISPAASWATKGRRSPTSSRERQISREASNEHSDCPKLQALAPGRTYDQSDGWRDVYSVCNR